MAVDLLDRGSIERLAAHAVSTLGGIDIFVGNAANVFVEQIPDLDLKSMAEVLPNLPTVRAVMVEQDPGTVDPVGDMRQSLIYLGDTFRVAF